MPISVELSGAELRSVERAIAKLGDSTTANQLVGKAARVAAKAHLIKPAKAAMPMASGQLRKATKIRSIKRRRDSAGVQVGFSEKDFVGDQFYGAFQEYGFRVGPLRLGDARTKIAGRGMLRKVADQHGKKAQDMAAKLIADAMEKMAKK